MNRIWIFLWVVPIFIFYGCKHTRNGEEGKVLKNSETILNPENRDENDLSPQDLNEGWELLFDGKTTAGWHSFKKDTVTGWYVEDGALTTNGGNNDLLTNDEYENFILSLDWKIAKGGNSGIMYHVGQSDKYKTTYETGPEYQLIDDVNYPEPLHDTQHTGANYALQPPSKIASNPAGEYNHSRIVVDHGRVQHWLNDVMVVEYELRTDHWRESVNRSKFKDMPDYGMDKTGHIALQDHGDRVWFKNIKLKII